MWDGDYKGFLKKPDLYLHHSILLNYAWGIEIKATELKGRGLFATEHLKRGDLLFVEKAVAVGSQKEDGLGYSFSGDKKNLYDVHDLSHMN